MGSVLITENETEGFLIDLDHAIRADREADASGVKGCTGTKVFMSIDLLVQGDSRPHRFMDDLESIFWLLFLDMRSLLF